MKLDKPSRTAIVVAKSQALVGSGAETGSLVSSGALDFAKRALEAAGCGGFVRRIRSRLFRRLMRLYESVMIPGLALHQVLRKNVIERRVRAALRSGIGQVIQVGSGLDSLCYRLHREWRDAEFVEFDHPSTQLVKRKVIDSMDSDPNLRLEPIDLANPDPSPIAAALGKKPSIIVVEGVMMYLAPSSVATWLRNWRSIGRRGSRLLFTFMDGLGFRNQSFAVNWWLRHFGEPFRWHADRDGVKRLLSQTGWDPRAFHSTWKGAHGNVVAKGEWICEAAHAEKKRANSYLESFGSGGAIVLANSS